MIAAVVVTTACNKETIEPCQITMTTGKLGGALSIFVAGTGTISIDWGDGSETQTHPLWDFETQSEESHRFQHIYNEIREYSIIITGENIIHFGCTMKGLTKLDISKNAKLISLNCGINQLQTLNISTTPALKLLICKDNQIQTLDVSKNKELVYLDCNTNQLSSFDISQNKALEFLYCQTNQLRRIDTGNNSNLQIINCSNNQLTELNVQGCTSLSGFNCENNLLPTRALNTLFESLHENMINAEKNILISQNPGATDCNKSIAESKGWFVSIRAQ